MRNRTIAEIIRLRKVNRMMKEIAQSCAFTTSRLEVKEWSHLFDAPEKKGEFARSVTAIMSPEVTASLPEDWQGIHTVEDAERWIQGRADEGHVFAVRLLPTHEVIGFLFLYEDEKDNLWYRLRLGYLLSKEHWGNGFGSELIQGLLKWGHEYGAIQSIVGGVDRENIGSIIVLERNGFLPTTEEGSDTHFYEYTFAK